MSDLKRKCAPASRILWGACRRHALHVWAFSGGINILFLTLPIYMLQLYDRVLPTGSVPTLVALTLGCLVALMTVSALDAVRARLLAQSGMHLDCELAQPLFAAAVVRSALGRGTERGEVLRDLDTLRHFAGGTGVSVFFDAPWTVVYLAVLFLIHPVLGWLAVAAALLVLGLAAAGEIGLRKNALVSAEHARRSHAFVASILRNAEATHAMGMLAAMTRQWDNERASAMRTQLRGAEINADLIALTRFLRLSTQALMLAAGAYLAIDRAITPGAMFAATIMLGRALHPVEAAAGMWRQAVSAWQAFLRIDLFLSQPLPVTASVSLPRPRGRLTVEHVSFAHTGALRPVLRSVSFAAEPGTVLGIVGPSAAGKSTLARLLVGIYEPAAGSVRLDGARVFEWKRDEFGPFVGYLPQDVELFSGSVAANIGRFTQASSESIVAAAQAAGAHEMILRLPLGYDTEVGDGGTILSAGQRQRIALARAVFGGPALVVLDEPNSNLDSAGDAALAACLAALKRAGTTVLIVTHRGEILNNVDRILCLQDGAVVGHGPRHEILKRLYRSVANPARAGEAG